MALRTSAERVANAKRRLATDSDVWLATASPDGVPHLIPLSLGWDGKRTRNVEATGLVRASLDDTSDVVIIHGTATAEPLDEVAPNVVEAFVERADWDPRSGNDTFSLISVIPDRILAWQSEPEIQGRTIMRNGEWVTGSGKSGR